ncbi:hypothetical protein DIPPA_34488 [Diplonema papillatum]|nr:hypothetical protein DIPPA_34488 [Diplonema papillatum]
MPPNGIPSPGPAAALRSRTAGGKPEGRVREPTPREKLRSALKSRAKSVPGQPPRKLKSSEEPSITGTPLSDSLRRRCRGSPFNGNLSPMVRSPVDSLKDIKGRRRSASGKAHVKILPAKLQLDQSLSDIHAADSSTIMSASICGSPQMSASASPRMLAKGAKKASFGRMNERKGSFFDDYTRRVVKAARGKGKADQDMQASIGLMTKVGELSSELVSAQAAAKDMEEERNRAVTLATSAAKMFRDLEAKVLRLRVEDLLQAEVLSRGSLTWAASNAFRQLSKLSVQCEPVPELVTDKLQRVYWIQQTEASARHGIETREYQDRQWVRQRANRVGSPYDRASDVHEASARAADMQTQLLVRETQVIELESVLRRQSAVLREKSDLLQKEREARECESSQAVTPEGSELRDTTLDVTPPPRAYPPRLSPHGRQLEYSRHSGERQARDVLQADLVRTVSLTSKVRRSRSVGNGYSEDNSARRFGRGHSYSPASPATLTRSLSAPRAQVRLRSTYTTKA